MATTSILLLVVGGIIGAGFGYAVQASRTFDREHNRQPRREARQPATAR